MASTDLPVPGLAKAVQVADQLRLANAKRRKDPLEIEALERELHDRVEDIVWEARYPR